MSSGYVGDIHHVNYYTNKHIFFDMDGVLAAQLSLPRVNGQVDFVNSRYYIYLPPVTEVIKKAKALQERGHEIYILSASPTSISTKEKEGWLNEHLPFMKKENIYFVNSGQYKAEMYRDLSVRLKLDLKDMCLIEDTHKIIYEVQELPSNAMHVSHFLTKEITTF